jgi:hypothetical protein
MQDHDVVAITQLNHFIIEGVELCGSSLAVR